VAARDRAALRDALEARADGEELVAPAQAPARAARDGAGGAAALEGRRARAAGEHRSRQPARRLMPALPLGEAGKYVAAAYLVVFTLVIVYVAIMAAKLQRIERELESLNDLVDKQAQ